MLKVNRLRIALPTERHSLVHMEGTRRYNRTASPYALVSSAEATRFLGHGLRHIYRLVQKRTLKIAARNDGRIYFRLIDLCRLKESRLRQKCETNHGGKLKMVTKDTLQNRLASVEEILGEILSLAIEIKNKAQEALENEGKDKNETVNQ